MSCQSQISYNRSRLVPQVFGYIEYVHSTSDRARGSADTVLPRLHMKSFDDLEKWQVGASAVN